MGVVIVTGERKLRGELFETLSSRILEAEQAERFHGPDGALAAEVERLNLAKKFHFNSQIDHRFSMATALARAAVTFWLASEHSRQLMKRRKQGFRERMTLEFRARRTAKRAKAYLRHMDRLSRKLNLPIEHREICDRAKRRIHGRR